jgi:hypothetical protein
VTTGVDARRSAMTERAEPWGAHNHIAQPSSLGGREPWTALERAAPPQFLTGYAAGTAGAPTHRWVLVCRADRNGPYTMVLTRVGAVDSEFVSRAPAASCSPARSE